MAKTRSISKAGRQLLRYLLREHELLGDDVSQAEIASWFGVSWLYKRIGALSWTTCLQCIAICS